MPDIITTAFMWVIVTVNTFLTVRSWGGAYDVILGLIHTTLLKWRSGWLSCHCILTSFRTFLYVCTEITVESESKNWFSATYIIFGEILTFLIWEYYNCFSCIVSTLNGWCFVYMWTQCVNWRRNSDSQLIV